MMQLDSREHAHRLRQKYPGHIPVVVEVVGPSSLHIRKQKFIVHQDTRVGAFCHVVRKYIDGVSSSMGLFYYYEDGTRNRVLAPLQLMVGELDSIFIRGQEHAGKLDPPPILTLWVAAENAFGGV